MMGSSIPWVAVSAQTFTAYDLLAAVNNLRASNGLAPYQTDGSLMAYAQEHSEYQARTGISTHIHSDGNSPRVYGVTENIASGSIGFMTLDLVMYQIWADSIHMNTMIGYESGSAGVGIAVSGGEVYITLDVRPGTSASALPPNGSTEGTGAISPASPPIALVPLTTATPNPNGSVVHLVGYGQSLWSIAIAYGVKIDEIRTQNGLVPGSTDIYAGQKLVIHTAGFFQPSSATLSEKSTTQSETPTVSAPKKTSTPRATAAPQITPSPELPDTPVPEVQSFNLSSGVNVRHLLAGLLILVGLVGVIWVLRAGFKK